MGGRGGSMVAAITGLVAALACGRGAPSARDTATIAAPYEIKTLDPHVEDKLGPNAVLMNVYEALVATDADLKVVPGLAESWESADPLTWTFRLRPDLAFHDGRPLRAADVVWSLERLRKGGGLELASYLLGVTEVEALDARTVRVRTARPVRILLTKLSHAVVVPAGEGASLERAANGTGPYRVTEWKPGLSIVLERNERYWGRRPALRRVEYVLSGTLKDHAEGLRAGHYQLVQGDSRTLENAVRGRPSYELLRGDNVYTKYLGFDLARRATPGTTVPNPFLDRRVREAVHRAIDRRALVSALPSDAVPATQPLPRLVFGFDPGIPVPVHDPRGARRLLEEAGLGVGFEVVMHARSLFAASAEVVRRQLGEIGIRVEVKLLPASDFFTAMARREGTLWLSSFGCATGDASDLFDDVLHSTDSVRHVGTKNYGGHADPALDRLIEASADLEKVDERREALQAIVRRAMESLVLVPLYNDQDAFALERSLSWRPRSDRYIRAAEIGAR